MAVSVAASVIFLAFAASAQTADNSAKVLSVTSGGTTKPLALPGEKPKAGPITANQIADNSQPAGGKDQNGAPKTASGQLVKNEENSDAYQRALSGNPVPVIRPFAQAEDGQGKYQFVQAQPAREISDSSTINGGEPPMEPSVAIGRPGGVTNELDLALGQRQIYSDLRSLQDRINIQQQPVTNAITRYSTQSDNIDIAREEISQDFFFAEGASRLRPGIQLVKYTPDRGKGSGNGSVFEYSGGADGSYRINDFSAITGDFWLNEIEPKHMATNLTPTYDLYLTLWPNDLVRLDIDNKRETFDNITSLQMGITAESIGGSIDYTPTDDLRFTLRTGGSFYTDTNQRESGEAEAVWRVMMQPVIEIGVRGSAFSFSKQLNNGYFNPDTYYSGEGMVRIQTDLTDRLNVELAASGGLERANPGGDKPLVKTSLQFSYRIVQNWSLDGGVAYFSSQESNSSGFARTSYTLGLHYRFD